VGGVRNALFWAGIGLVLGVVLGVILQPDREATPGPSLAVADQHAQASQEASNQADILRLEAEQLRATLAAAKGREADLKAEVQRLKSQHPGILQPPEGDDPCPDLRALALQQDGLIQAQEETLQVHERRESVFEDQAAASDRAAQESRLEAKALRLSLAAMPRHQPWSAGPLVGCNLKGELRLGAIVSRSWTRVQVHGLVLNDTVAIGGSIRFGGGK
jgi:hypothetical protein